MYDFCSVALHSFQSLPSRFYLGLALCQQKGGPSSRQSEAMKYVSEGLEYLLNQLTSDADKASTEPEKKCQADLLMASLLHTNNIQCLHAFTVLGNLVRNIPSLPAGVMSATDAYHTTTLLSSRLLCQLVARGDTYHQAEWLLLEAQSLLLQMMLEAEKEGGGPRRGGAISWCCENLSALIKGATIPPGCRVVNLQEKVGASGVLFCMTVEWSVECMNLILSTKEINHSMTKNMSKVIQLLIQSCGPKEKNMCSGRNLKNPKVQCKRQMFGNQSSQTLLSYK